MNREEFRLDRVKKMGEVSDSLAGFIGENPELVQSDRFKEMLWEQFQNLYDDQTSFALFPSVREGFNWFYDRIKPGLDATVSKADPRKVADWLGTAIVNAASAASGNSSQKMWLSRRDQKVRPFHVEADGQKQDWKDPFTVCDGVEMQFPGEPVGDPSCWLNCRCVLADPSRFVVETEEFDMSDEILVDEETFAPEDDLMTEEMEDDFDDGEEFDLGEPVPWHAVLVPEGTLSGDGRKFSEGAITWRDLPLPLRVQFADEEQHGGAILVGSIEDMWRDENNLIKASGTFLDDPAADKVIGQIGNGPLRGISVDVDQGELAADMAEDEVEFAKGRVSAATIVQIPAFAEVFIALGPWPEGEGNPATELAAALHADEFAFDMAMAISEKPWDGSAARFTPEEYARSCCLHRGSGLEKSNHSLPIREPNGDLSRAGVHAAAGRINQVDGTPEQISAAKKRLLSAYRQLGEEPPESLQASADFARGPGWVTNPKETRRLWAYWTQPGHKGYAKIRWGTPGDFTRLRRALAKYIRPDLLNRVAARWHHDALGYWPGELGKPGNPPNTSENRRRAARHAAAGEEIIVASAEPLPYEWFQDPKLEMPTGLTIEGRRIFGHIAEFDTCHVGKTGVCVTAPHSQNNYAYFRTGAVVTDQGIVPVGNLTMDVGHADEFDAALTAKAHYDNTSTIVADLACGEDEHGIWVAGALRASVTDEQERAILASPVSGDWRPIGGSLELIAALLVPVPGFPVRRTQVAMSGEDQTALILASGLCSCKRDEHLAQAVEEWMEKSEEELITGLPNPGQVRASALRERMNPIRAARLEAVFQSSEGGQ